MVSVTAIPGSKPLLIGEGPHWVEKDQALVYVDIFGGYFYRFFTETGRIQEMKPEISTENSGHFTTFIVPIEGTDDEFIISVGRTVSWIKWSISDPDYCTKKSVPICSFEETEDTRFNDGKCDPQGRLWAGTMAIEKASAIRLLDGITPEKASLYRLNSDLSTSTMVPKVTLSNGLAWTADRNKLYYIDSTRFSVDVFNYDDITGEIANRRVAFDYKTAGLEDEFPDGMCIDANGHLWIACFKGAKVICVDPEVGKIIRKIEMPSLNITSCCWGGKDYSTLYVTSCHRSLPKEEFVKRPMTGKTFAVTGLGVKGLPPVDFKIDQIKLESLRKQL